MFSTESSILFIEFLFGIEHFSAMGNRHYQKCVFQTNACSYSLYEVMEKCIAYREEEKRFDFD